MITGRQIRAARGLLDMKQEELAKAAGLTKQGISKIEDGAVQPREGTRDDIMRVFTARGIEFMDNQGVRFRPNDIEVFEGRERFNDFTNFLYEYLRSHGGDVCISTVDERFFSEYRKDHELHRQRMKELVDRGDVCVRILATESKFVSAYAKYKWQPSNNMQPTSFYAFGECLALISFVHTTPPYVVVIRSQPIADAYRSSFETAWANAQEPEMRT